MYNIDMGACVTEMFYWWYFTVHVIHKSLKYLTITYCIVQYNIIKNKYTWGASIFCK